MRAIPEVRLMKAACKAIPWRTPCDFTDVARRAGQLRGCLVLLILCELIKEPSACAELMDVMAQWQP